MRGRHTLSQDLHVPEGTMPKISYISSSRTGLERGHTVPTCLQMKRAMWRQSHSHFLREWSLMSLSAMSSVQGTSRLGLNVWWRVQHLQDVQCSSLACQLSPGIFLNASSSRAWGRERPCSMKSASSYPGTDQMELRILSHWTYMSPKGQCRMIFMEFQHMATQPSLTPWGGSFRPGLRIPPWSWHPWT